MVDPNKISIVHWFPDLEESKCGYCKSNMGRSCYGMWAETLTLDDYQNLIDRGWRRSGNYCYKPVMNTTCCPQYTIRCDAENFKISKSQKKIVKKFNKFQEDGIIPKTNPLETDYTTSELITKHRPVSSGLPTITHHNGTPEAPTTEPPSQCSSTSSRRGSTVEKTFKAGIGADPNKPPCKKAKLLRLERKQQKLGASGMTVDRLPRNEPKTLSDLLGELPAEVKCKLRMRLVSCSEPSIEWERTKELEYELFRKYQLVTHDDESTLKGFKRFLVSSPLKMRLVRMDRRHVHFQASALLYAKYQISVHNDSAAVCAEDEFHEFLVKSPLESVQRGPVRYGSFHQQYWLADKLIAVGVIDVLPKSVSSVYFFYDPDYRGLTLGTYGALREIEYTNTLHRLNPSIMHYYMGFYVHSCPKMRYKGKFLPSDLLCPETYTWFPIEKCILKLDVNKYSRLNEDASAVDANASTEDDLKAIKIFLNGQISEFRYYKYRHKYADAFDNLAGLVGRQCARTLLVVSPHGN